MDHHIFFLFYFSYWPLWASVGPWSCKQRFCLHLLLLSKMHYVYPWGPANMLNAFPHKTFAKAFFTFEQSSSSLPYRHLHFLYHRVVSLHHVLHWWCYIKSFCILGLSSPAGFDTACIRTSFRGQILSSSLRVLSSFPLGVALNETECELYTVTWSHFHFHELEIWVFIHFHEEFTPAAVVILSSSI